MRRVHIDDLEELVRHSEIINTTKTFTMKKLHMDASLRLGGARRNRTLTSWRNEQNPSALPTELQAPWRGREHYPLFYPQTFNIALFGKKGQIPLPYPWGVGTTPIKPTSTHIRNDPLGDVEQNHPLHTLILKPKPIYEKTIATHVGIGLSGRESNPHLAPMEYSRL